MDSPRKRTIRRYIDGYNRLDEQQIRTCLAERVKWTVLGDYQATGSRLAPCSKTPSVSNKSAPRITIRRLTEEGETVVAELLTEVDQTDGSILRLAVSETYIFEDDLIAERRAFVVPVAKKRKHRSRAR
ncbi:MAG: hypothetical protein CMK07_05370 [Ponticaulis sp.]|nr:hypothetical protein [Ponticaulis sp.]